MKIGIFANIKKQQVTEVLTDFFKQSDCRRFHFTLPENIAAVLTDFPSEVKVLSEEQVVAQSNCIIAFGGDGTILRTAQKIGRRQIPILGVNMGGLGFLAATSLEMVHAHLQMIVENGLAVDKRSVLQMTISGTKDPVFVLNDLVVDKAGFSRVIKIRTEVNGQLLNSYIADGLVISTPTGSTAYSLANGGPIVIPQTGAFIINPICPHTLSNRPVVIPDNVSIHLNVRSELGHFQLFGDGRNIGTFDTDTSLTIVRAPYDVHLVSVPDLSFYDTLRSKLGWGDDFRNKQRWSYNDKPKKS